MPYSGIINLIPSWASSRKDNSMSNEEKQTFFIFDCISNSTAAFTQLLSRMLAICDAHMVILRLDNIIMRVCQMNCPRDRSNHGDREE